MARNCSIAFKAKSWPWRFRAADAPGPQLDRSAEALNTIVGSSWDLCPTHINKCVANDLGPTQLSYADVAAPIPSAPLAESARADLGSMRAAGQYFDRHGGSEARVAGTVHFTHPGAHSVLRGPTWRFVHSAQPPRY